MDRPLSAAVCLHVLVSSFTWTIVAETLRVLSDEGKEVVLHLLVFVDIQVNVFVVLVPQFPVTTRLSSLLFFSMLSILMSSIIMFSVLVVVLLVVTVLKTCLVLLVQLQLDGDGRHHRLK